MVNDDKNLDVENADTLVIKSVHDDLITFDYVLKNEFQTQKTIKFLEFALAYCGREFSNAKKNEKPYALGLVLRKQEILFGLFESKAFDKQSRTDDDDLDDDLDDDSDVSVVFSGCDDLAMLGKVDLWLDRIHFLISMPVERNDDLARDCMILLPKTKDMSFLVGFVKKLLEDRSAAISLPFFFFDSEMDNVVCRNLGGAVISYFDYVQRNVLVSNLNARIYGQLSGKDKKEIRSLLHRATKCCGSLGAKEDDLDRLEFAMLSSDFRVVGVSNDHVFQGECRGNALLSNMVESLTKKDYVLVHRHVSKLFTDTLAIDDKSVLYRFVQDKKIIPILDRFVSHTEINYLLDDDTTFSSLDVLLDLNLYLSVPLQTFNFPHRESDQIVKKRDKDWYYQNISEDAIDMIRELILEYLNASALSLLVLDDVSSLFSDVYLSIDEKTNEKGLLDWRFSLVSAKSDELQEIDEKMKSGDIGNLCIFKDCVDNDLRFSFPIEMRNRVFSIKHLYDVLFSVSDENMNLLVQVPYKSTPAESMSASSYRRSKANVLKIIYFDDAGKNVGLNFSLIRFGKKDI